MDSLLSALQITVHEAGRRPWGRGWRNRDYFDSVSRIWFVESGDACARHHGRTYSLRPGWLYLVPAHTPMSFHCRQRFVPHWVHFNATLYGGPELFRCVDCRYAVRLSDPEHVRRSLVRLETIVSRSSPALQLEVTGIVLQLVAPFLTAAGLRRPSADALANVRGVLAYVDAHLQEPITAADMARVAHQERSHFSRLFSRCMGIAPSAYLQGRRIQKACEHLLRERIKLAALATRVGFTDASNFSRVFKRRVGVSPREFRRRPRLTI
jgi:AraC-like DNA-binding protein